MNTESDVSQPLQTATFGGGCFWCVEAIYLELTGVEQVRSGYAGGHTENPTYEQVCTGQTGHAEVVQILFDPSQISYEQLLHVFFKVHDPTTLNQQGADRGTQYRSVIFYDSETQQEVAERVRDEASAAFTDPIVTEISPLANFYPAENYHQNYFALHGRQPYCQSVISPKLEKFRKTFKGDLKTAK